MRSFVTWLAVGACACFSACGEDSAGKADNLGGEGSAAGGEAGESSAAMGGADLVGAGRSGATGEGGGQSSGGAGNCPEGAPGSPPQDYLAEFASGTRLEVRYISAPGLPQVFAEVFDTELGVLCDFVWASDDELRCLPRSVAFSQHLGFADAGCRHGVGVASPACDAVTAYVRRSLDCRDQYEVGLLAPHVGPLYRGHVDSCAVSTEAVDPQAVSFGEVVPPESFVAGELKELPGVCRATLRVVVSEDGARVPFEVIDIATGAACNPAEEGCTPLHRAFEEPHVFSDASCETEVEQRYGGWEHPASCGPPDFIGPVGDKTIWYRPGDAPSSELYLGPVACAPMLESPWYQSVYELGTAVPLSDLAPLEAVRRGDGRLQVEAEAEQAQPLFVARGSFAAFYDTERDEACRLRRLADGSLRCIPLVANVSGSTDEYEDSDCTVPVRRCSNQACAGTLFVDGPVDPDACTSNRPVTGIWRATAAATGLYRKSPGLPCAVGGDLSSTIWRVEAVAPSTFAAATFEAAPLSRP